MLERMRVRMFPVYTLNQVVINSQQQREQCVINATVVQLSKWGPVTSDVDSNKQFKYDIGNKN